MNSITKKDSYVMYKNWSKGIQKLTDEQAGQLLKAICHLQDGEEAEPEDIAAAALYEIFKAKMIEDAEAYQAKVDRLLDNLDSQKGNEKSQKGKNNSQKGKSDSQMGNKKSQKGRVATVSVTDTDTVTDTVTDKKDSYGELGNVKLTLKEHDKLIERYGADLTTKAIEYLDGYIEDKGYKSKSNYQAIIRWVIDTVKDRASPETFDVDAYLRERAGL